MTSKPKITAVLAMDNNGGIGKNNDLPWPRIREDMAWFVSNTKDKIVVMGSNTWRSLPAHVKPLKGRVNVILSRAADGEAQTYLSEGADLVLSVPDFDSVVDVLAAQYPGKEIVIIGGALVFNSFLHLAEELYLTRVESNFDCDTFVDMNVIESFGIQTSTAVKSESGLTVLFQTGVRIESK